MGIDSPATNDTYNIVKLENAFATDGLINGNKRFVPGFYSFTIFDIEIAKNY